MKLQLVVALIATLWISGCQNFSQFGKTDRQEAVEKTQQLNNSTNRPSEDNGGLPGYMIHCDHTKVSNLESDIDCSLVQNGNPVPVEQAFENWIVSVEGDYQSTFVKRDPRSAKYSFGFTNKRQSESFATVANASTMVFEGILREQRPLSLRVPMAQTIQAEETLGFRYLRLDIRSIELSEFVNPPQTTACVRYLEAKEQGVWQNNVVEGDVFRIGNYIVTPNAGFDVEGVHLALIDDIAYWETEFASFGVAEPFNSVNQNNWFSLDFGQETKIEGIRLKADIIDYPVGECVPDDIEISVSNDGRTWRSIQRYIINQPSQQGPWITIDWGI
ncbi:discoidin domain-containing protein [Pseudobacteriovorax antillogorgiicola]|uniref:Uncharacterized protein n=1 Tax=Pseudobacteriovorax antillogorgiicola TaxID=1513793 RepID=A0A1Y6CKJ6_9BACT|nr:discoidin domain-containing protein [Pseudobacteriovorax antillogorgiicola]TCS47653.1 hypothetical protein EDD56_12094 [Pseudobacteriovorax antillogorgiicola]SMF59818.1 hypothetical protein SAMN06296036_12046 [Pseudobacteriovorax antillogorgiicola]